MDESNPAAISPVLLKKYKRMMKAGVPIPQIQQMALVEAQLLPEQVNEILDISKESSNRKQFIGLPTQETSERINKDTMIDELGSKNEDDED